MGRPSLGPASFLATMVVSLPAQGDGEWLGPFTFAQTTLQALPHVGLIPTGPNAGKVVILDFPQGSLGLQMKWYILDPEANPPTLVEPPLPTPFTQEFQQLTCAEHAWTADGRWVVAGGTGHNGSTPFASQEVWVYDPNVAEFGGPPEGEWTRQPTMDKGRWYPSVVLTGKRPSGEAPHGELIIAGGFTDPFNSTTMSFPPEATGHDDYQVFRPGDRGWTGGSPQPQQGTWRELSPGIRLFPGPTVSAQRFGLYPRLFLMPDGHFFLIGRGSPASHAGFSPTPQSTRAVEYPTDSAADWEARGFSNRSTIFYGPAAIFPNFGPSYVHTLINIAGENFESTNVEWADAGEVNPGSWPSGHSWTRQPPPDSAPPPLNFARKWSNTVILPDGSVLVSGGNDNRIPELLKNGVWTAMEPEASPRDLHAWAILLPSGRVLSGGGDTRTPGYDFEIFEPAYLSHDVGPRPSWGNSTLAPLAPGEVRTEPVWTAPGTSIAKVVLIRTASLTHHCDTDMRYVELSATVGDGTITFTAPDGPPDPSAPAGYVAATAGYYMAFLVTNTGIPSVASFAQLLP